ncbi:uncharacterized protein LOC133791816 [Humulus lupulus]|uniref:uncharacterized protein LOC133791816 n=1 Tax=Humulus lupulus TaxID=3486 RepID=UPI002B417E03|nr:uncharacterized protein LOC133791816 [Humulus lupulus]
MLGKDCLHENISLVILQFVKRFYDVRIDFIGTMVMHFFSNFKPVDGLQIFIPVHIQNIRHFVLFLLHVGIKVVEIWDSLLHKGKSRGAKLVQPVLKQLDDLLGDQIASMGPDWSFSSFTVSTVTNVPQQSNSYDCGIFVVNWMEQRPIDDFQHDSKNERSRVAGNIFTSKCNKLKESVMVDAMIHRRGEVKRGRVGK